MKHKKIFISGIIVIVAITGIITAGRILNLKTKGDPATSTTTSTVRFVSSVITANGAVTAQSQARLNFQTGGKLTYLPLREGDRISAGQVIAQLDTYDLKRQLTTALNNYRMARDTFDQTQNNSADGVLKSQQLTPYDYFSRAGLEGSSRDTAINNALKRLLDQSQANLDNSVINVELANYALQLSRLVSPISGIVTHEDVTVPGVNITSQTTFTVADPETMVFRANIPLEQIYYVSEGSPVTLAIDGIPDKIKGTVTRIYPGKVTLGSGQAVYQADIRSDELLKVAKLETTGQAVISTNAHNVALVPAWTVLNGKYIWVEKNGTPELKEVTVGKIHGNEIEVTKGLSENDKIIINPESIPARKYLIL